MSCGADSSAIQCQHFRCHWPQSARPLRTISGRVASDPLEAAECLQEITTRWTVAGQRRPLASPSCAASSSPKLMATSSRSAPRSNPVLLRRCEQRACSCTATAASCQRQRPPIVAYSCLASLMPALSWVFHIWCMRPLRVLCTCATVVSWRAGDHRHSPATAPEPAW